MQIKNHKVQLNLIRKIAWKYTKKTKGIPFDEFFSEASLAYVKALKSFNESKNCTLTTHLCCRMEYACCHFITSEYAAHIHSENVSQDKVVCEACEDNRNPHYEIIDTSTEAITRLEDIIQSFSKDALIIYNLLLGEMFEGIMDSVKTDRSLLVMLPRSCSNLGKATLRNYLSSLNWTRRRITNTYNEIKLALK